MPNFMILSCLMHLLDAIFSVSKCCKLRIPQYHFVKFASICSFYYSNNYLRNIGKVFQFLNRYCGRLVVYFTNFQKQVIATIGWYNVRNTLRSRLIFLLLQVCLFIIVSVFSLKSDVQFKCS